MTRIDPALRGLAWLVAFAAVAVVRLALSGRVTVDGDWRGGLPWIVGGVIAALTHAAARQLALRSSEPAERWVAVALAATVGAVTAIALA